MNQPLLTVRELQATDIPYIIRYWLDAGPLNLKGMGADPEKLPTEEEWHRMLSAQLALPYEQKPSYCLIWLADGAPVGHSNVNKIVFGEEAYMHLHLWKSDARQKGWGSQFVSLCLPYFFRNMQLQRLYCEPYALNPAPNKTLERLGFSFLRTYVTVPGAINFEQQVNLWEMPKEKFEALHRKQSTEDVC